MKLFECDKCPKKLKCELTDNKNRILKKWCGKEMFKRIWDMFDDMEDNEFVRGHRIGYIHAKTVLDDTTKDFHDIMKDIAECMNFCIKQTRYEIDKKRIKYPNNEKFLGGFIFKGI